MYRRSTTVPLTAVSWSTSSFGDASDSLPMELAALSDHLHTCKGGSSKRLSNLQYAAELTHGFVASRFVTTLALAALLIGAGLMVL